MTQLKAAPRIRPVRIAAVIDQIVEDCQNQTEEQLAVFNTNPDFNINFAYYIGRPGYVLTNGQWDELVRRAHAEIEPDGTGNCKYSTANISENSYGATVQYICYCLAFSYGEACAVRQLNKAALLINEDSIMADIAHECATQIVSHESRYECGYETLQSAVIDKQLSAAATKVHIQRMIKCQVVNRVKASTTQPEINPFNGVALEEDRLMTPSEFSVEDQIQLEYLREFMHRAIEDLEREGDGVAKMVLGVYFSEEGQSILRRTDTNRSTFLSQLNQLAHITELNPHQTKKVHDEIVNAYKRLTNVTLVKKTGTRKQIKNKAMRSYIRREIKRYEGTCKLEDASYTETRILSPYITDEDYDLMVEAAASDYFFNRDIDTFELD